MIGGAKGIGIGIDFGIPNQYCRATSKPYIEKDVLDSLRVVASAYGKTNNYSDRAIVKNLVDPDNPFVISNAAYTEGSGYADKDSPYYGAFITDGIDDLITSTKTASEMGITEACTVISMIHQIDKPSNFITTNNIRTSGIVVGRNAISEIGKTGIYGWYKDNIQGSTINVINNILGDKADYTASASSNTNLSSKFSVVGYISNDSIVETSQVAWYWTIIANKVLTTDQINQVIAYFNLDRTLKPDILCNTIKQGITNENHAEFGDRLIDFSGNGRDIQLNNIAWKGDSGIGKYEVDFLDSSIWTSSNSTITSSKIDCKNAISRIMLLYYSVGSKEYPDIPSFKVIKTGADIDYSYIDETGSPKSVKIVDGVNILPASHNTLYSGSGRFCGFGNPGMGNSVTITQIPSHAGALCLGGVNDFGKVTGMPVYKDYTVVADYIRTSAKENAADSSILSKSKVINNGAFLFNYLNVSSTLNSYSFGTNNMLASISDSERKIYYQSKYVNEGKSINSGTGTDYDSMWLGTYRDNVQIFFNGAIYSLMSFPYSMSEFLIERQLKKHKLGTLYPDMVEFRPIVKSNSEYQVVDYYIDTLPAVVGNYYPINSKLRIAVTTKGKADEVTSLTINGTSLGTPSVNGNRFTFNGTLSDKSPQKIDITIDEYIRYEDIVQPYPVLLRFKDENGNEVSWGGKFKVGSTITRIGSFNDCNLLKGIYTVSNAKLNGSPLPSTPHVVEKSMVFTCTATWAFDNNEPKCILSPRLLRIPNSSYKILGYIPDISGHGNHGVIHNSAYGEGSGVNEDGSYQFDGVDDFVAIPTLSSGGKQVLMKVNWDSPNASILYDQRGYNNEFAIYNGTNDSDDNPIPAYQGRNNGQTYIDGILNSNIKASELRAITHNITITNELSSGANKTYPIIGSTRSNTHFAQMSLYDFMLFDEISTDDKIKELNEYVGIEAKVELPPYYWDTYGKTNLDADKATIQQRGVAIGDYDLTNYNHAYDKMSGYGGYKFAKFDNELDWYLTPDNGYIDVVSRNGYSITLKNLSTSDYGWYFQNSTVKEFITKDIPFKVKANKSIRVYWDMHSYKSNGENFGYVVNNITLNPNEDTSINLRHLTEEELTELGANKDRMYYLLWFGLSTLAVDEEVTIEMLPLYPNGLLYDGVTDYSENVNIPTFNDFTLLVKASLLNGFIGSGGSIAKKGNNNKVIGGGYDFIYALDSSTIEDNRNSYWSFGAALRVSNDAINPPLIGYMTKNNVNGVPMSSGANPSIEGITFSKWEGYIKMVLYKAMLYPKTIPLLQINFLKNLMEKDEIIDLNNKIFIQ